ncbi:MAG: pyruvate kinase [Bacteroidales bacterium]
MKKLTKIIATISDKRCDVDFLNSLNKSGMDAVRINTAHQTPDESLKIIKNVREVSDRIPILIDTKGPEIRTCHAEEDIIVNTGDVINVKGDPDKISSKECLYVDCSNFANLLETGKSIMIDDGDIELVVSEKTNNHLVCTAKNKGIIKQRKSVNLPGTHVNLPSLTDKDKEYIQFAIDHNIAYIAHSFVRNKEDVVAIQEILDKANSPVKIIAKIENQQGVDNIDEILDHVYGVMIARGDLAIEIPAEKIPGIQTMIINKCILKKRTVIVATQMLHSMIINPRPTRAEVTDIANAVFFGTDAIMLSGETAIGKYPVESVQIMTRTAIETEKAKNYSAEQQVLPHDNDISVFLSKTAVRSIAALNTKAIITDTDTGKTARYLAAFRGRTTIYAQCYDARVVRELGIVYGVYADFIDVETSKKTFIKTTINRLIDRDEINPDNLIAVLAGNFGKKAGPSFVEISTASNLLIS